MSSILFTPLKIGRLELSHRIVLAPLTRLRADAKGVHQAIGAEYYKQRASEGGLIIVETTIISEEAGGFANMPGVWSDAQVAGWKAVVDAVHAKGGYIFLQLCALGRHASPELLEPLGHKVVSASNIPLAPGLPVPEPLKKDDILRYVNAYVDAAKNAVDRCGFDGVEIHNGNGTLLDQFLQTVSNKRTDEFGGSEENRSRFTFLVADAVTKAVGEDRVGIRFTPFNVDASMGMKDPYPTFTYVVREVRDRFPNLAYVHFVEPRISTEDGKKVPFEVPQTLEPFHAIWTEKGERPVLTAGGLTAATAVETVEQHGGAAVFGRYFISNPDLPYRIKNNLSWNPYNRSTFYSPGPEAVEGYIDYPFATELTPKVQ